MPELRHVQRAVGQKTCWTAVHDKRTIIVNKQSVKEPTMSDSVSSPRHIGELLPQVLARYGIELATAELPVSSARMRRRLAGALKSSDRANRPGMDRRFASTRIEPAGSRKAARELPVARSA